MARGFGKPKKIEAGVMPDLLTDPIDHKTYLLLQRLQRTKLEFQVSTANVSGGHILVYNQSEEEFQPTYNMTHRLSIGGPQPYRFAVSEAPINVYATAVSFANAMGVHINKTSSGVGFHGVTNLIANQARWFQGMDSNTGAGNADFLIRELVYGKNLARFSHLGVTPKILFSHSASGSPSGQLGFMHVRGPRGASGVLVVEEDTSLSDLGTRHTLWLRQLDRDGIHDRTSIRFGNLFLIDTDSAGQFWPDLSITDLTTQQTRMTLDPDGNFQFFVGIVDWGPLTASGEVVFASSGHIKDNWNVYGKTGLGIQTVPTATLELKAGSTSLAPLKFTAGTNLSATQDGTLEYDGAKLQFTPDTDRRIFSLSSDHKTSTTTVQNTTTRTNVFQGTLSANSVAVGQTYEAVVLGHYDVANGSNTFDVTMQVGSTDVMSVTSTAAAVTGAAVALHFVFTIRSLGAGGTIFAFTEGAINTVLKNKANTSTTTINTTAAMTVELDVTWSAADNGNVFHATQGYLRRLG